MSIRMIQPDEIRVGQTLRVTQRFAESGAKEPYVRSYRGEVVAKSDRSVTLRRDGRNCTPLTIDDEGAGFEVEITVLAEYVDPRIEAVAEFLESTHAGSRTLAQTIIEILDGMQEP
jgi:hypothetical protein